MIIEFDIESITIHTNQEQSEALKQSVLLFKININLHTFCYKYTTREEIDHFFNFISGFSKSNNLKIKVFGKALQFLDFNTKNNIIPFPNFEQVNSDNLAIQILNKNVAKKSNFHTIDSINPFKEKLPILQKKDVTSPAYPFIFVDVSSISKFYQVF